MGRWEPPAARRARAACRQGPARRAAVPRAAALTPSGRVPPPGSNPRWQTRSASWRGAGLRGRGRWWPSACCGGMGPLWGTGRWRGWGAFTESSCARGACATRVRASRRWASPPKRWRKTSGRVTCAGMTWTWWAGGLRGWSAPPSGWPLPCRTPMPSLTFWNATFWRAGASQQREGQPRRVEAAARWPPPMLSWCQVAYADAPPRAFGRAIPATLHQTPPPLLETRGGSPPRTGAYKWSLLEAAGGGC